MPSISRAILQIMKPHGNTPAAAVWKGESRTFPTALAFATACVQAASAGAFVLCATARLARRFLHYYRLAQQVAGTAGWETPQIRSFRGWVNETCDSIWSSCRPLTPALSLRLWHQAIASVSPPDGLIIQPALYRQLQLAMDALFDNGIEADGDGSDHPLAGFRRAATRRFLELAKQEDVMPWSEMLSTVRRAVAEDRVPLPPQIILAGFDNLSPLENILVTALAAQRQTVIWHPAAEPDDSVCVRVFAAPEQECRAVCADVLRNWNDGRKNLGVVFADRSYLPILKRCFDDLAGLERPDFEKSIRYNLTVGTPLADHPLFQTAVLPLRALDEPEPAPLLTSLLVSPYVGVPGMNPQPLRDALWEPDHSLQLEEALRALEEHGFPVMPLSKMAKHPVAPLADWLARLNDGLAALGFCRFEGQYRATDALAQQHLNEIITALTRETGDIEMDGTGVLAWLSAAADSVIVAEKTPETAGIQILNLTESRGLAFDCLWVVGAHGAALPPPMREWPFLDPDEQRRMDGGTLDQQWDEGRRRLASLWASAPNVYFSRATADGDASPYPPCPLLADETGADGQPAELTLNVWKNPSAEWLRARWLRDGHRALVAHHNEDHLAAAKADIAGVTFASGDRHSDYPPEPAVRPLSGAWNVTALEDLAACPFQFFCGRILKLEPLSLADAGIDPRVRGKVLHGILTTFVDGLAEHVPSWPDDNQSAQQWLTRTVDQTLARCPRNVFWRVERLRLMGDANTPGILPAWLEQERQRAHLGWRFAGTELAFEGLPVAGITLRGRIDRIDRHPQEGFAVWDYKSGAVPSVSSVISQVTELQLPAYLLALQKGLLSGLNISGVPLQAGYIGLKKASEIKITPLSVRRQPVNWTECLPEWETNLDQRLDAPRRGRFEADPRPAIDAPFHKRAGACQFCEFFSLCGYFDRRPEPPDDDNGDGEEYVS
ncbi:MAG: PD-(D/E)XK nuclease family protein [Verrucomicrobia bacterium]|nr:PD-(D/E)XK nuclease family protein [Verrucomicrobiota bacterium]MCG2678953.1 PD-(D/E)XK nuclease family protein [Kiritimatiellia bacterium]MBU4248290.1 PD-(D/E)XK nuclease family protein [Verrucomicrobiota bacterium]MBU4291779.1 PD-(D/E)XK nuclease family protein [Verrucomicrobiota bacterium]MBU4429161.1 PD-(D/E)XK nuclease family protein [Verrucomicrobiota bacterium]